MVSEYDHVVPSRAVASPDKLPQASQEQDSAAGCGPDSLEQLVATNLFGQLAAGRRIFAQTWWLHGKGQPPASATQALMDALALFSPSLSHRSKLFRRSRNPPSVVC